ncbi:MAG: archaeosortase/exosortase family protein [Candidatus Bathyarchaeota archaeon]|nr:archaeosortase/exosortase family protein [Candidatus Bathyarchaeota archaeon]
MVAKESTMRYNVFYITSFAAILLLFYWVPSGYVEALTAEISSWTLAVLGHAASWEQLGGQTTLTLIGQHAVTVSIIRECTALNVFGVMAGLILPLRASWVKRLTGIAISGVLLFSLNIPRIALTVYLTAYDTWPFTLMAARSLETYHYPISFAFGVLGVALTVLAVSRWTTPELGDTLLGFVNGVVRLVRKGA